MEKVGIKKEKEKKQNFFLHLETLQKMFGLNQFKCFKIYRDSNNQEVKYNGFYKVECEECKSLIYGKKSCLQRHLNTKKHIEVMEKRKMVIDSTETTVGPKNKTQTLLVI
ncbi:hypothetical protein M0812_29455 [Anaeramoeba flamelloides]|uniref:C2H2-type domain-containing protein n=1 Tax=Anaeramoeba flamelloides TaxID=1746091 RepID=A0AAV7Y6H1_9EUKA|nr:hypothetical protein M0812_29455 [Anaeramoeba flamelloides]